MMRRKYSGLLALMVAFLTIISMNWYLSQSAQAATAALSGTYYTAPTPGRVPGTGLGTALTKYPAISNVQADGTATSGGGNRVTKTTKSISFTLKGSLVLNDSTAALKSVSIDVLGTVDGDKSGAKKSVATKLPTETTASGTTYNFPTSGTTYTVSVDLSKIEDEVPLYVALKYTTATEVNYYSVAILTNDTNLNPQLVDPTAADGTLTTKTTSILTGDERNGTYDASGNKAVLTVNDGATSFESTFGTAGSYLPHTFSLGDTKLIGGSTVTLKESNQFGDYGIYTTTVKKDAIPLISSDTTSVSILPDEVSDVKSMSDSDVIDWLVKKTNIVGKDTDTGSTDGITIKSDTTDLASKINALAEGASTTIDVYAENSDGNKSTTLTLTITRNAGSLSLSGVASDMSFGNDLKIPSTEETLAPTGDWGVEVDDTRTVGSNWSVTATATAMTSDSHTLAGDLVYKAGDGSANQILTNQSVKVASGQRAANATTTKITQDWNSDKGILLDVKPSTYVGTYSGQVNWTLQDTP